MEALLKRTVRMTVVIVGTGLGGYIVLSLIAFAAISAFWGILFQTRFPDVFGDTMLAGSLNRIESVIFATFLVWLRKQTEGFTDKTEEYSFLLEKIKLAGQRLSRTVKAAIDPEAKVPLDSKEKSAIVEHAKHMNTGLQFLAFYCYKIFDPDCRDVIQEGAWAFDREVHGNRALRNAPMALARSVKQYEVTTLPDIPEDLANVAAGSFSAVEICTESRGYIFEEFSRLSQRTEGPSINANSLDYVVQELKSVKDALARISAQDRVKRPQIFSVASGILLVAWFGIWLPITIWIQFFTLYTIFIYSIVMFAITSPWIFRQSLGQEFRNPLNSQWKWRDDAIDHLQIEMMRATGDLVLTREGFARGDGFP
jgi:hypothetical protein